MSVGPPTGNGTMIRIGRLGYSWAAAEGAESVMSKAAAKRQSRRRLAIARSRSAIPIRLGIALR